MGKEVVIGLFMMCLLFGCIDNTKQVSGTPTVQACRSVGQNCAQTSDCCESLICLNYVCTTAPLASITATPSATPTSIVGSTATPTPEITPSPTIEPATYPTVQATTTPTTIATSTPTPSALPVSSEELKTRVDSFSQKYHELGYNNESSCNNIINTSTYMNLLVRYGPPIRISKDVILTEGTKINGLVDEIKSFDNYYTNKETIITKISEILSSLENYKGNCSNFIYGFGSPTLIVFDDSDLRYVNCTLMGVELCTFTSPTPFPTITPTPTPTPTPTVCPTYDSCIPPDQSYAWTVGCPTPVRCATPTPTPTPTPIPLPVKINDTTYDVNGVIVIITLSKENPQATEIYLGEYITVTNNRNYAVAISPGCNYPVSPWANSCRGWSINEYNSSYPRFNYAFVEANSTVKGWIWGIDGDYLASYNTTIVNMTISVGGTQIGIVKDITTIP